MPYKADHALSLLSRAQKLGRMAHAYLISGPREARLEDFAAQALGLVSPAGHAHLDDWAQERGVSLRGRLAQMAAVLGFELDDSFWDGLA